MSWFVGTPMFPYDRTLASGRRIINAGSVGKPKDNNPHACYLTLSAEGKDLTATFIRVPYDLEQAARFIESTDMPDEFAEMLRLGKG